MLFCPKCGTRNKSYYNYCHRCGTKIKHSIEDFTPKKKEAIEFKVNEYITLKLEPDEVYTQIKEKLRN